MTLQRALEWLNPRIDNPHTCPFWRDWMRGVSEVEGFTCYWCGLEFPEADFDELGKHVWSTCTARKVGVQ